LSLNQESSAAIYNHHHAPVAELVREQGDLRRAARHRHWLRPGYVEELYLLA
jgi:hypothetical protein